jgi:small GTP-binding protein
MKDKDLRLQYKFLILGDSKVGKTSLIERYISNTFKYEYITTIGMDRKFKRLEVNDRDVDISITDTAGQERFRSISRSYYKGADGILIGFSLTNQESLENVSFWIGQIDQNLDKDNSISLVLFGNKCDDKDNIKVTSEDIDEIKEKYNLKYFETSAKENINVKEVFEYLTKATILKRGNLQNLGLNKDSTTEDIIIKEKENQNIEIKRKKTEPIKKKSKC